ncbi:S41 family peptidase [Aurantiacibacter hainanensis]|uniref:S41 family peptidase n=1 Tax=Aurantiacibacter hainanensis TaxID=3076114 RepID=UPI0030C7648D
MTYRTLFVRLGWAVLLSLGSTLFALLAPTPAPVAAQEAPVVRPAAVVEDVRRVIARRYVLPEKRPALDAVLAEGLAAGRYDVTDPVELAARINADLSRVGQDKHLTLSYDPRTFAALRSGEEGGEFDLAAYETEVRSGNHGVTRLLNLPGNVRYLEYTGFDWIGEESAEAIDTAMRFLAGGDAAIIDLRRNGGGSPEAVQHMVSHFLKAGQPLVTFYMEGEAEPGVPHTLDNLAAPRMVGMPLYVLISGGTGSAAEEFAGHVSGFGIGELVGENTAGAGFRNTYEPVGDGFALSVSIGRAVLASTGRDWEGTGHAPTIPTSADAAMNVAWHTALARLAQDGEGPDRDRLAALADNVAALSQSRPSARSLDRYAGTYGTRGVRLAGETLAYMREGRVEEPLVPLGGDRFTWRSDPSRLLTFVVEGEEVTGFELGTVDAPARARYQRGPAAD